MSNPKQRGFTYNNITATVDGKASLWNAACHIKDVVYKTIFGDFGISFLESNCIIFTTKNCIGPYRSQKNIQHMSEEMHQQKREK